MSVLAPVLNRFRLTEFQLLVAPSLLPRSGAEIILRGEHRREGRCLAPEAGRNPCCRQPQIQLRRRLARCDRNLRRHGWRRRSD